MFDLCVCLFEQSGMEMGDSGIFLGGQGDARLFFAVSFSVFFFVLVN